MLLRSNPHGIYRPQFAWDRRGLLILTRRWVVASGVFARCWS